MAGRALGAAVMGGAMVGGAMIGHAWAHHGWGSYDAGKVFTMTGPVAMMEWSNPHVHVMVDHGGARWEATLAPIFRMQARGLAPEMLAVGTVVSIEGYPSTRTPNEMRAERITVAGKTFELR
jgi:hypothetical protein